MNTILLSINPEHVENIINGSKKYEFRRTKCKQKVEKILIYATSPIKLVIGEVAVLEVLEGYKESVWSVTAKYSGISKAFYNEYYSGKQLAVAYKLGDVCTFPRPLSLKYLGIKTAPQSFMYLSSTVITKLLDVI